MSFIRLLVVILAISAPVMAHEGAMGIVKERMDGMTAMGKALKELTTLSKTTPIDPARVATQADILTAHSGDALLDLFPPGSLQDVSEARETIWTNWDRFARQAHALEDAASDMRQAKTSMTLQNAVTLAGQTCSSCHKAFRIEK